MNCVLKWSILNYLNEALTFLLLQTLIIVVLLCFSQHAILTKDGNDVSLATLCCFAWRQTPLYLFVGGCIFSFAYICGQIMATVMHGRRRGQMRGKCFVTFWSFYKFWHGSWALSSHQTRKPKFQQWQVDTNQRLF